MKLIRVSSAIEHSADTIIRPLTLVAFVVTAAMVLVVFTNVVGRYLFKWPLLGTIELVELMMTIISAIAMAYATIRRTHVRINVLISRFSSRTQKVLDSIIFCLNAVIFAILASQALVTAIADAPGLSLDQLVATTVLSIPMAPFRFILFVGFLAVFLVSLAFAFNPVPPEKEQEGLK